MRREVGPASKICVRLGTFWMLEKRVFYLEKLPIVVGVAKNLILSVDPPSYGKLLPKLMASFPKTLFKVDII